MNLPAAAIQALQAFSAAASWEQRARLLLQWAEQLQPLTADECNEANRVHGCESLVWLVNESQADNLQFRVGSDARLLRGLLAVLLARVNGLPVSALAEVDLHDWFQQLGLSRQLSPSRSNGLNAVLQRMGALVAGE